jgi:hypothetical protein
MQFWSAALVAALLLQTASLQTASLRFIPKRRQGAAFQINAAGRELHF